MPGILAASRYAFTPSAAAMAPAPSRLCPHPWPQPPETSSSRVRLPPFWERPESASYSASRPMMGRPLP